MSHKERLQEQKENAMCGLDLPTELRSSHADDDDEFESLLAMLKGGETYSNETVSDEGKTGESMDEAATEASAMDDIREINRKFSRMVDDFRPAIQDALNAATEENPGTTADKTWKELRSWDQAFHCTTEDCEGMISVDIFSNHQSHYRQMKKLEERIESKYGVKMSQKYERLSEKESSLSLKRYLVHWQKFRETCHQIVDADEGRKQQVKIRDQRVDVVLKDRINVKSTQPLASKEVRVLTRNHPLLAEMGLRLNTLEKKMLHCRQCKTTYWTQTSHPRERVYFHRIAGKIIRSVVETAVGNAVIRAPKSLVMENSTAKKDDHTPLLKAKFGDGGLEGKAKQYRKLMIGEAILTAFFKDTSLKLPSLSDSNDDSTDSRMALKESQADVELFIALGTEVVERLAAELMSVKPKIAFHTSDGIDIDRDEWCKSRAVQLLYAVHAKSQLFKIEKTRNFRYTNGDLPEHESNLVRLTDKVHKRIRDDFTVEVRGVERNMLKDLYHRERLHPMLCAPKDRSAMDYAEGGFCTTGMQKRKPLISDKDGILNIGYSRFTPSEEAVKVINLLQGTKWTVDRQTFEVVREVLENEIQTNIRNKLGFRDTDSGPVIDYKGELSGIRHGQVREWYETFAFIEDLFEQHPGDPTFWHPWYFDWRGRMYTVTTILSPQNDDVCRGLLRFGDRTPVTEDGLKWIWRRCASYFRGLDGVGTLTKGEAYLSLIEKLEAKTWECYDDVGQDPLFIEMLKEILALPVVEGFAIWGQGDVFRAKAEGFQRYTIMSEYIRILDAGGVGTPTGLPINLDASSSVYQHAAALLNDLEMAKSVNVSSNENIAGPADIYLAVVAELKKLWQIENPLDKFELEDQTKEKLTNLLLTRKVAKKPVMTHGYGAGEASIARGLLTHNQDPDGDIGGWIKVASKKDLTPVSDESEGVYLPLAHPESTLKMLQQEGVPGQFHLAIAKAVIADYVKAIVTVLPSFKLVTQWLRKMVRQHQEMREEPIQWELPDGSEVVNQYWHDATPESVAAWAGLRNHRETVRALLGQNEEKLTKPLNRKTAKKPVMTKGYGVRGPSVARDDHSPEAASESTSETDARANAVPELLGENVDFSSLFATLGTGNDAVMALMDSENERLITLHDALDDDLKAFVHVVDIEEGVQPVTFPRVDWAGLRRHLSIGSGESCLGTEEIKLNDKLKPFKAYVSPTEHWLSYRRKSGNRKLRNEENGVSPNFIHSIDALHMRRVVLSLGNSLGLRDFWSVHDSFGCHPNFVDDLAVNVRGKFGEVHSLDDPTRGIFWMLLETVFPPDVRPKKIPSPGELTSKLVNSPYLVN